MTHTEPTLRELTYTRTWEAPRELVFECMSTPPTPHPLRGPAGVSTPLDNIKVELRPGGVFETVMVNDADGAEFPMRGVFVEVVPPEKLSWTEADVAGGMTTSITFNDLGDGRCETIAVQTKVPEQFATPEARAGMESSFDKMAAYLATL